MESKCDIFIFTIHLQPMGQITNILIHFQCIQVLKKHVSSCKKKYASSTSIEKKGFLNNKVY